MLQATGHIANRFIWFSDSEIVVYTECPLLGSQIQKSSFKCTQCLCSVLNFRNRLLYRVSIAYFKKFFF